MKAKDVKLSRCGVPLRPPSKKCADCKEGLIICEHRGECGKTAWSACPRCSRFICEKCFDFICCGYRVAVAPKRTEKKVPPPVSINVESKSPSMTDERNDYRADAAVSVSPLLFRAIALLLLPQDVKVCSASCVPSSQSVPVAVAPVATCATETKVDSASPVESDRMKSPSMSTPSVSVAMEKKNDQVERISCRNHVHMNVCDRYTSLADLCLVFGIEKKASKQEKQAKQAKKSKLATTTPTSSPSFSSPSSFSFTPADARYNGWGVRASK